MTQSEMLFSKPYVWLVGAGRLQEPICQAIQARGYAVLATDGAVDAYCASLVDKLVILDTYDVASHLAYAKTLTTPPSAVLTDAADVGPTVSALAEYFALPACSYQAASATRDKAQFRQLFKQTHPKHLVLPLTTDPETIDFLWREFALINYIQQFPAIVKPADNCASRGVTKVLNSQELVTAFRIAAARDRDATTVIIEECLFGPEFATDWLVVAGEVVLVNACARIFGEFGRELGHHNPWLPPVEILQLAGKAARALGVTEGPFKLDWLYDKRYGWLALEGATRWSGGFDHTHSAYYATGRRLCEVLLDYALGLPLDKNKLLYHWQRECAVYAPTIPVGYTINVPLELQAVAGQNMLHEIIVTRPGVINPEMSCADRPVFIITSSDSAHSAWLYAQQIGMIIQHENTDLE